ncbi:MAG: hypothetical protein CVV49_19785 [Spirochaetae bacterium HGW-Spirochaetae-5]|nr:MAG: hypothetical protein CVV49_19785 [Spirochaetae bacterium HGW-Spirochaetae-5]
MDRIFAFITMLPWIPLYIILETFSNSQNAVYKIYKVAFFPTGMFFSLYLDYYFSLFDKAEELEKKGEYITIRFLHKKRFVVSLLVSVILLVITIIVNFTIGFDFFIDLLDEDDFVSLAVIILFLLLIYVLKYFANFIYRRI